MTPRPALTQSAFVEQARLFAELQSALPTPELFGVTDGKTVGTHVERAFKDDIATQWRLQYSRVIDKAGAVSGISRLR